MNSEEKDTLKQAIELLITPFDTFPLYISFCCDRVYVGKDPAKICRTCIIPPKNFSINSLAELDSILTSV